MKSIQLVLVFAGVVGLTACGGERLESAAMKSLSRSARVDEGSTVPVPGDAICTADVNEFGHPSSCSCPENYQYDSRFYVCRSM